MSNVKISALPAAAALVGTEPIPTVQSGVTVRTTPAAIAALAPTAAATIADMNSVTAIQPSSVWLKIGFASDPAELAGDAGVGSTWEHNPVAGSLALLSALQYRNLKSAVAVNSYAGFYYAAHSVDMYRKLTAGGGGLQVSYVFGFTNGVATRRMFIGVGPYNDTTAVNTAANPSTKPNLIGLLKDSGDANVQIAWTSNASVPTKVDTGVSFTSLSGLTLRFLLTIDRGGSTGSISLMNLATGINLINSTFTFDGNAGALDLDLHPLCGVNSGPSDSSAFFFGLHKMTHGSLT